MRLPSNGTVLVVLVAALAAGCISDAGEPPAAASEVYPADTAVALSPPLTAAPLAPSMPPAPERAPDVTLTTLDGDEIALRQEDGVLLINFWATWCAPYRAEIPDLIELQDALGAQGLTIVGISEDLQGEEVVRPFLKSHPVNYPIVIDQDGDLAEAFGGVLGLPTTFVVAPGGRIVNRTLGIFPIEQMKPRLKELLAENEVGA